MLTHSLLLTLLFLLTLSTTHAQAVVESTGGSGSAVGLVLPESVIRPHLDVGAYSPMPMPQRLAASTHAASGGNVISYDISTGREQILVVPENSFLPPHGYVAGSAGISGSVDTITYPPTNFGSLSQVTSSSSSPWRVNVKVFITFPHGNFVASGVLIDSRHVLTAGHCVYDYGTRRWATSIRVVPAYANGSTPYGDSRATNLYSWTAWTNDENMDWDMGYIRLDRPVGALAGWHGYGYDNSNTFFTNSTFRSVGYPAASPYNGGIMYYSSGTHDLVHNHIVYFNRLSYGGQSGSGSHLPSTSIVYGALSHTRTYNGTQQTGTTRITSDKFNSIRTTISANTPSSPDLVPLDMSTGSTVVSAGGPIPSFNFVVHNYCSGSWSGRITFKVYLSTNDVISSSDILLQTRYVDATISSKSYITVTNSSNLPIVPRNQSGGTYYLGIILDVSDNNTANNATSGWDAAQLRVNPSQTSVEKSDIVATEFALSQNFPNPFNPSTTIQFSIPATRDVTLRVHNSLGQDVATLVREQLGRGTYAVTWNAEHFASGLYFYRLQAGEYVETRKLILSK